MKHLGLLAALLVACSAPAPGVALGDAGAAGALELTEAGSAGRATEVASAGEGGAVNVVGGGAPAGGAAVGFGGAAAVAGGGSSGAAELGGSAGSGASLGGAAGADVGGSAGSAAGSPGAGSSGAPAAGSPGVACFDAAWSEAISAQSGHRITATFPALTWVNAVDLAPLAGYTVVPTADGIQVAKAFAGGALWPVPSNNRMKALEFLITPYASSSLMPAGGFAIYCKQ